MPGIARVPGIALLLALVLFGVAPAAAATGNRIAAALDSLAIKADGGLWAWGYNAQAQLGDGTMTSQWTPVLVGAGYASIAAGRVHTLAVMSDGSLWAWGQNSIHGNLGTGGTTGKTVPFQIAPGGYASVAAGNVTSFGIKTDASLWAWGRNDVGQLGDGTTVSKSVPVQVQVGSGFAAVAAGYNISGPSHTVGVKTDGSLWAWGYNQSGQVGDGSTTNRLSPVQIGSGFASVAAGSLHSIALKVDGSLWAWGYNFAGQLGDGTTTNRLSPVQVGAGFASISAGSSHTVAIRIDGSLWAWGANSYGQLGDGTVVSKNAPVQVGTATDWFAVAAGETHTVALKSDGTLWAWGRNDSGQLGGGSIADQLSPIQIDTGYAQGATTTSTAATTTTTTATTTSTTAAWTTTSTTSTTTASTTSTTIALNFVAGWNLVGNSASAALDVAATFGDPNKVNTIWKWLAPKASWAFYTPTIPDGGAAYAVSKGYDMLNAINGGEGFWVNAKTSFTAQLPAGTAVTSTSFLNMTAGWNLIAIGDNKTPREFNTAVAVTTLWAWDAAKTNWYFYAPSLDANGTLPSYIAGKGYLDFGATMLYPTTGFWVNKP